jgi:hypothetical protein
MTVKKPRTVAGTVPNAAEIMAWWSAWLSTLSEAKATGNLNKLASLIRSHGSLGEHECDDLADLMETGRLTLKREKPDSEYRLALAAEEVRRLEQMLRMKTNADGSIRLIKRTRAEAIDVVVKKRGLKWGFDHEKLGKQLKDRSAARRARQRARADGRDWPGGTAPRKAGRPKKNQRAKSA